MNLDELMNLICLEYDDDGLLRTTAGYEPDESYPVEMSFWLSWTPSDGQIAVELVAEYVNGNTETLQRFESLEALAGYARSVLKAGGCE